MTSIDRKKKYTYEDYLTWPDDERWEIIEGVPYNMTPAPSTRHQRIAWELSRQIGNFLNEKTCEGYFAPFDVRLSDINVVQPDIVVICDPAGLDDRGCHAAPDWAIEIISPHTASKDHIQKRSLYEKYRVKEYWIIDPIHNFVTVHLLGEDGKYGLPAQYEGTGRLEVVTLPDLRIDLDAVFK